MLTLIKNATYLDTQAMSWVSSPGLLIEDGIITNTRADHSAQADDVIDAGGLYVLPGLIDAHVHFRLATLDFAKLARWSEVQFGIVMAKLSRQTVERGYTTVRDTGGDLSGLMSAIKAGQAVGPRIVRSGLMISQTGGHGDAEGGPRAVPDCACQMRHTAFGIVADGADAVRKAARHNLRDGSDFLKIHVSGGVATPSDPLECTQYTAPEIAAAVLEAEHRNTYVTAHAYTPESIRLAVENGVRCIEHGNLIDQETADLLAERGVTLVPTLVTYKAMDDLGKQLGLPQTNRDKNKRVLDAGLKGLELAHNAGVTIGWGTDLIGETQSMQSQEFALRAEVQSAKDILNAMFVVNPKLLANEAIGEVAVGKAGDLVLSAVDPLADIRGFADTQASIRGVIQAGQQVG